VNRLLFFALSLLPSISCVVVAQTTNPAPVPPALAAAKTIFISNAGADAGLFPEPFTGDPSRGYNELYRSLQSSGAFVLTADPSQADLVLELRLTAPYGPSHANKMQGASDPLPMFTLTVYDRKTHYVLWTLTQTVEYAVLQKTHDRNFDTAIGYLAGQFLSLTGHLVGSKSPHPAATPAP
jgi:hypothetical protein